MYNSSFVALAVLTATTHTTGQGLAVLSGELASDDGWYQLLPDGEFSSVDGRPSEVPGGKWKMNAEIAARLINKAALRANDMVIDYEHQTLKTEENGKPAPAAGWFKEMEYRPGKGLFIKPAWLSAAKSHIDAKEYRYLSAVFPYDKKTGEPLDIQMAALTNYAGLDGMEPLAVLAAKKFTTPTPTPQGEDPMKKTILQQMLEAVGIVIADGAEPTAEQATAAVAALAALKAGADSALELTTQVAALKANPGNVDLAKYVPIATYNKVVGELAVLRQQSSADTVDSLIEQAAKDGKIVTAERDYLKQLGDQNGVAVLKAVLDNRPAIAALKGQQTTTVVQPKQADDELNATELAVLKATGLDKATFLKAKAEKA